MATNERVEEVLKICGFRPDDQTVKDLAQIRFMCLAMGPEELKQVPISVMSKISELIKELDAYLEVVYEKREKELNGEQPTS
jgi:hypothetical protein